MIQQQVKIGILGCGMISDVHIEGILSAVPNAEVVVCDPLPGKAEMLRAKYKLKKSYLSYEEMLSAEKPFAVHICTPPQYHIAHALACLKAGCHVLVEKPFALDVGEIEKVYDAARDAGKVLCVNHSILFQPCVAHALSAISQWPDASTLNFTSFFGIDIAAMNPADMPADHWKRNLPGGTTVDTVIHPITLAVTLTGKPANVNVAFIGSPWQPDELQVTWKGETGFASITASTRGEPFRRMSEITTNRGTVVVDHSTEVCIPLGTGVGPKGVRKIQRNLTYGMGLVTGTFESAWKVARKQLKENPGVRHHVAKFYEHLLLGAPATVSRENVLNATTVLAAIAKELTKESAQGAARPAPSTPHSKAEEPNRTRRILITGASGLLGNALCEALSQSDRQVIAQVRRSKNAEMLSGGNVKKVFADFNSPQVNYEALVEGVDEIVHTAHSAGAKTWEQFKSVNVDASVALYKAAKAAGCKRFVYLSSVAVYGVHRKRSVTVNEETPAILGHSHYDFYVRSKTTAERSLMELARQGGPELLIIRPGLLYGKNGKRLLKKAILLKDTRLCIIFGNGSNHLPFTRVESVARAICRALDSNPFPTGIYQLTGRSEEPQREFVGNGMKKYGVNCSFVTIPALPLYAAATVLESVNTILLKKKPPAISRYILDSMTRNYVYDCSKAARDLNWDADEASAV